MKHTHQEELCGMPWAAPGSGMLLFWAAWVDAPGSAKGFQLLQSALSRAWLRYLYTNTHGMGNKQGELETCTCLLGCEITGITVGGSCGWDIGMEGSWLFMEDRLGRQGGGVSLEEYGEIVQEVRDEVQKAKDQ